MGWHFPIIASKTLFLQPAFLSLTNCFYELLSVFICLPLQRESEICLFLLATVKTFLNILPRVSKRSQWVIIHWIGWLFRWITCSELFVFTSPTHNFLCSHMAINTTSTHIYICRRTNIEYRVCAVANVFHTIWVIHCSPDPLLKMQRNISTG